MNRRALLLCNDGLTSRLVARALAGAGCLDAVLIVGRTPLAGRLRWRARRHGVFRLASQLACAVIARALAQLFGRSRRDELLDGLDGPWPAGVPTYRAAHVNHLDVISLLASIKPDVVVLNGTEIVKSGTLVATTAPFINIHCGLTPDYRGVHGAFWAMWNGDPGRMGVTLHRVDRGVDTGEILAQARIDATVRDGFLTLPLLQYRAALPLLVDYLTSRTTRGPLAGGKFSRQWFHPGLGHYLPLIVTRRLAF
jgi:hypothetical protein